MTQTYHISGMTCTGCQAAVTKHLTNIAGVTQAIVDLEKNEAVITSDIPMATQTLQQVLPSKYSIKEKEGQNIVETKNIFHSKQEKSKLQQLQPLFLIFAYLCTTSLLLHYKSWTISGFMIDFMGLFFIVFSFFKLLDLKGFPTSFRMYDPLAKIVPVYAWIYPFIEIGLGLMLLMRFQIRAALIATIVILGITTIGVTRSLLGKKEITCACLGTALKLPMTQATFIENTIMIAMAIFMLTTL